MSSCTICGRELPLERHHPLGRAFEPALTDGRCKQCHRQRTDEQAFDGLDLSGRGSELANAVTVLRLALAEIAVLADAAERHLHVVEDHLHPAGTCGPEDGR